MVIMLGYKLGCFVTQQDVIRAAGSTDTYFLVASPHLCV